jgi:hypothetical protein
MWENNVCVFSPAIATYPQKREKNSGFIGYIVIKLDKPGELIF